MKTRGDEQSHGLDLARGELGTPAPCTEGCPGTQCCRLPSQEETLQGAPRDYRMPPVSWGVLINGEGTQQRTWIVP